MDRNDYFKNPVSKIDVPDYHEIVKKPMCWTMIEAKLDKHEYWDLSIFKVSAASLSFPNKADFPRITSIGRHQARIRQRNAI